MNKITWFGLSFAIVIAMLLTSCGAKPTPTTTSVTSQTTTTTTIAKTMTESTTTTTTTTTPTTTKTTTATSTIPTFGNALSFDGVDDYVQVGDLGLTGNWTIQFWAKLTSSGAKVYYPIGLSTTNPTYSAGVFIGFSGDNWGIYDGNTTIMDSPITIQTWHHYAVMKDGTNYTMCLDGVVKTSGSLVDIMINDLVFGKRSDNFWNFPGIIDEVKISNIAVTSFEISSPPTIDVNTVGLWHFDEVSGLVAADAKGIHQGTLVNGPIFISSTVPAVRP